MTTRGAFLSHVLGAIGGNPNNREAMIALLAQAAGENTRAENNPLATTEYAPGATPFNTFGDHSQFHVWNFADPVSGVGATVRTIQNGFYPSWLAGLTSTGRPAETIVRDATNDLNTWGTGAGLVGGLVARVRDNFDAEYNTPLYGDGNLDPIPDVPAPPPATPCPTPYPGTFLRHGSRGPDVGAVREACYRAGSDPGVNDQGDHDLFGANLDAGVRDFQSSHVDVFGVALDVDGIVGPLTWGALFGCA